MNQSQKLRLADRFPLRTNSARLLMRRDSVSSKQDLPEGPLLDLDERDAHMTRTAAGIMIFGLALTQPLWACSLSHEERLGILYKTVQMLSPTGTGTSPAKGLFRVKARHYYNISKSAYVPVTKISVHEYRTWATEQTEWNIGKADELELRMTNAEVGKDYQVRVDWADGQSYTWEYSMKPDGTTVTVDEPL